MPPEPPLLIRLRDADALAEQEANLQQGCLLIPSPAAAPAPLSFLQVRIETAHAHWNGSVQVLQHLGPSIAIALPQEARDILLRDPIDTSDESESGTVLDRIKAMTGPQKMQLALSGNQMERLLLMKDPNKTLHTFVIQNPQITLEEVRFLASNRQANPDALNKIAANRLWVQNAGIVAALVRNPKTPSATAIALLARLPAAEVARLAKSSDVPRLVQEAARKKVITR